MSEDTALVKREVIDMAPLQNGGEISYITDSDATIILSKDILRSLVNVPGNTRPPTDAELVTWGYYCITQHTNPYTKECWLVYLQGRYECIIAAQKRIAKAQAQSDYDGYEWGWITRDGDRHTNEPGAPAPQVSDIVGCWGRVYRKNQQIPFYHEVYTSEYYSKSRPLTMLLKVCRDQTHRYAYADVMGSLLTENEVPFVGPMETHDEEPPKSAVLLGDEHAVRNERHDVVSVEKRPSGPVQGAGGAAGVHGVGEDQRGGVLGERVGQDDQQRTPVPVGPAQAEATGGAAGHAAAAAATATPDAPAPGHVPAPAPATDAEPPAHEPSTGGQPVLDEENEQKYFVQICELKVGEKLTPDQLNSFYQQTKVLMGNPVKPPIAEVNKFMMDRCRIENGIVTKIDEVAEVKGKLKCCDCFTIFDASDGDIVDGAIVCPGEGEVCGSPNWIYVK